MRRLILMRHGSAGAAPAGGEDIDRPLTEDGRDDSLLIGRALAEAGLAPHKAYVSAAVRTRETWEAAARAFPKAEAQFRDDLYNADAGRLLDIIGAEADDDSDHTVMIVGHNPAIHAVAVHLLREGGASAATVARMERGFSPATAAAFLVETGGRLSYDGLFLARDLGGGGAE